MTDVAVQLPERWVILGNYVTRLEHQEYEHSMGRADANSNNLPNSNRPYLNFEMGSGTPPAALGCSLGMEPALPELPWRRDARGSPALRFGGNHS